MDSNDVKENFLRYENEYRPPVTMKIGVVQTTEDSSSLNYV